MEYLLFCFLSFVFIDISMEQFTSIEYSGYAPANPYLFGGVSPEDVENAYLLEEEEEAVLLQQQKQAAAAAYQTNGSKHGHMKKQMRGPRRRPQPEGIFLLFLLFF